MMILRFRRRLIHDKAYHSMYMSNLCTITAEMVITLWKRYTHQRCILHYDLINELSEN